jgi:L-methionine (R)-S-oxide reductase
MAEDFLVIEGDKEAQYKELLPQIKSIIGAEEDLIANLANICAMLKTQFNWWWIGFYIVKQNTLVLGPFQGPLACTRIALGKGVCGSSWAQIETIVVDDVDTFPGHIACSSASKSEIVVPIIRDGNVVAVLDVDSEYLKCFDEVDKVYLEEMVKSIEWKD